MAGNSDLSSKGSTLVSEQRFSEKRRRDVAEVGMALVAPRLLARGRPKLDLLELIRFCPMSMR